MANFFRPTRRNFLFGAGACVALPFLESLVRAEGGKSVKPPLRMGIFTVTGGTVLESFVPKEVGPLGKLPSILRPLDAWKNDLLVLSNLSHSGKSKNVNSHEHCAFMHLTGADVAGRENGKPYGLLESPENKKTPAISVDQRAAELVKSQSLLPSMEIGYAGGEQHYSFNRGGSSVPYEKDPRLIFERMFKGRQLVAPNWSKREENRLAPEKVAAPNTSYEKQVVDLVLEDAKRLNKNLGTGDKHKLGDYLEAIDAVEKRIQRTQERIALEALDIPHPGPSHPERPANLPADAARSNKMMQVLNHNPAVHEEYIKLIADLAVLAFQTDTTRVCTVAIGSDGALFPGVVTVGYERHAHTLEHQGNSSRVEDADPISREGCRQIHAWYTQSFAYMVEKMKNIDEGGSSLLDNSLLLYTSYMANGGHGTHNYPAVLAGKAGGSIKTGRHVAFQKDTPVANLYAEMLSRMGDTTGVFGNNLTASTAAYKGKLPDLV